MCGISNRSAIDDTMPEVSTELGPKIASTPSAARSQTKNQQSRDYKAVDSDFHLTNLLSFEAVSSREIEHPWNELIVERLRVDSVDSKLESDLRDVVVAVK